MISPMSQARTPWRGGSRMSSCPQALHEGVEMFPPQERLEDKAVTHRRRDEGAVAAGRYKSIEVPAAVGDAVILIVAAMQPECRRFGGGAPFEDQRIDALM